MSRDEGINRAGSSGAGRENGSAPRGNRRMSANLANRQDISLETVANEGVGVFIAFHGSYAASVTSPKSARRRPIMRFAKSSAPSSLFTFATCSAFIFRLCVKRPDRKVSQSSRRVLLLLPQRKPHCKSSKPRYCFFAF